MATPNSVCVLCIDGCSVWACVAMDREMKMFHHQFYEPHYSGPWQREAETGVMDTLDTAMRYVQGPFSNNINGNSISSRNDFQKLLTH